MAVTQASDTSSKTSYSIPTPNVGHSATVWMLKILPVSGKPEVLISDVGDLPQGSKLVQKRSPGIRSATRNSSGDEIANVNFLCDDIVHALKIQ